MLILRDDHRISLVQRKERDRSGNLKVVHSSDGGRGNIEVARYGEDRPPHVSPKCPSKHLDMHTVKPKNEKAVEKTVLRLSQSSLFASKVSAYFLNHVTQ